MICDGFVVCQHLFGTQAIICHFTLFTAPRSRVPLCFDPSGPYEKPYKLAQALSKSVDPNMTRSRSPLTEQVITVYTGDGVAPHNRPADL